MRQNLDFIRSHAIDLMEAHGLFDLGWKLSFRSSRYTAGCCSYGTKTITLSKQLMWLWAGTDPEKVTDTILHEIAHALAGHAAGHGPVWQAECARIGAKPNRCYGARVDERTLHFVEAELSGQVSLAAALGPDRPVAVCACHQQELTKAGECAWA